MEIRVHILKNLILQLENELLFFEENTKFLKKRRLEISKKYYVGLKINQFLESISDSDKTMDEIILEYQKFSEEKILDTNLTFGDVFVINENDSTAENIAYGLAICKDTDRYVPKIACEKIFQVNEAYRKIGEKIIVNCLQIFEEYFSSILKILISTKPEAYFYNKTIPYSELINKNFEDLTEELINQEVEALMYGVSDTIAKVNQIHKFKLEKYQDIWDAYTELDLRRNVIVHNEGRVNQKYLSELPSKYSKPQVDTLLICDDVYVVQSIESLTKFAYLLYYLISDGEKELTFLDNTAFEFLESEKWEVALFAYDLLLAIPTLKNIDKALNRVNRLIAQKHIDGLESTKAEIERFDVSGMDNRFVIAKKLLLEEHREVNELLKVAYPEPFDFHMIQTWPIFMEYRKSEEYKEFINEHQTEYAMYELKDPEVQACNSDSGENNENQL